MDLLSIVIPVYNEEEILPRLFPALVEAFDKVDRLSFEVILVNDGSRDRSWEIMKEQHRKDPRFRMICFSRNFGHQMALTAGIDRARGDAVVVMDADLQDSPAVVLEMVKEWRNGHDIVYGQRHERLGESWFKLLTAKWFYRTINFLSRDKTPENVGDFYLLSRRAVERLKSMRESHRYLRGMIFWIGFEPKAVLYRREARAAGTTKFPFRKMFRFAVDGIVSSSTLPLNMASYLGFASAFVGFLTSLWVVFTKIYKEQVISGWASLSIIVLFMGGIQLISVGIVGLYLARIYDEVRRRPLYIVREELLGEEASMSSSAETK
ncbi:MAG: glycosyltransferase family 2 protein [Candidatus Sumerlaeaceae bacterium]|nr:glycosyltransferase family 2 protein [Candidatus Sumerlaeaceae bacterium]